MGGNGESRSKVTPELDGERADKVLSALFPSLSRRRIRKLIEEGSVFIDGKRSLKLSRTLRAGEVVTIAFKASGPEETHRNAGLRVLFDGKGVIAVDKPPLYPSVPTKEAIGSAQADIADMKKMRMADVHAVNRLDLPVSGVLLFALGAEAAARMEELKSRGAIDKRYLAWVSGSPPEEEGMIDVPLSASGGRAFADPSGKPSVTLYRVLKRSGVHALLEIEPVTGRMHQIRAHLREAGFPVVGDRKYGTGPHRVPRPLLHCASMAFDLDGRVEVVSPLPGDFEAFDTETGESRD